MKERPIIFSGEMVRAILEGRKTQTRRVCKFQPEAPRAIYDSPGNDTIITPKLYPEARGTLFCVWQYKMSRLNKTPAPFRDSVIGPLCPYGQPGDRLWVREAYCHAVTDGGYVTDTPIYRADNPDVIKVDGDGFTVFRKDGKEASPWIPSIHMPRWASRITLEITGVRVERVQEIDDEDAIAEGIKPIWDNDVGPVSVFAELWDDINAARGYSWGSNPWVWVVEFKQIQPNAQS